MAMALHGMARAWSWTAKFPVRAQLEAQRNTQNMQHSNTILYTHIYIYVYKYTYTWLYMYITMFRHHWSTKLASSCQLTLSRCWSSFYTSKKRSALQRWTEISYRYYRIWLYIYMYIHITIRHLHLDSCTYRHHPHDQMIYWWCCSASCCSGSSPTR